VAALAFALPAAAGESSGVDHGRDCRSSAEVAGLASETASAGYVSNILNRDGSIRSMSHRMLSQALESARSREPTQWVVFTSTPEISDSSQGEDHMCADLERVTKSDPIKFENRHFASADELTDWIMDFTQGNGTDGKSLYKQCPGKCSPRYTWWIEPQASGLKVDAWVVCGQPRDRSSNKYYLTTGLARAC
jgi:hypothetical protein